MGKRKMTKSPELSLFKVFGIFNPNSKPMYEYTK